MIVKHKFALELPKDPIKTSEPKIYNKAAEQFFH